MRDSGNQNEWRGRDTELALGACPENPGRSEKEAPSWRRGGGWWCGGQEAVAWAEAHWGSRARDVGGEGSGSTPGVSLWRGRWAQGLRYSGSTFSLSPPTLLIAPGAGDLGTWGPGDQSSCSAPQRPAAPRGRPRTRQAPECQEP